MASSPLDTLDGAPIDRTIVQLSRQISWNGSLLQVQSQIDAMQIEHDHKRMMSKSASITFATAAIIEEMTLGASQTN